MSELESIRESVFWTNVIASVAIGSLLVSAIVIACVAIRRRQAKAQPQEPRR